MRDGAVAVADARESAIVSYVKREWQLVTAFAVWVLFLVNFESFRVASGDEQVQFGFAERIWGDVPHALGYYFGLALAEAPFYGIGKGLRALGITSVYGNPTEQATVALGLGLLSLGVWPLLVSVIRGLRLRSAGFAILAAALGTPFFYYAIILPGKNHALDALLFTAAIFLTYRYLRVGPRERWALFALGAVFGFSYVVRYFDGAAAVMLLLLLVWWRRWRDAVTIAATSAVVCGVLFIVPAVYGVRVFSGGNYSAENILIFAPLNPFRMLFTDHRGYLVWSPIAIIGVAGLVLLFRNRPEHRRFLIAISAMAIGIMSAYSLVSFWDGTWAFGQRFFTPLFPLVAIGLAGAVDAAPRIVVPLATAAVAWSLFLCFNLWIIGGPQYNSNTPGGASDVALLPSRTHTSLGAYAWGVRFRSHLIP